MIENQLEQSKKSIFLGYSKKYTLYDSGCLVHCIARLVGKPVLEVHERLKGCGCFFADLTGDICLLDLTKVPNAYPQLKWISKETVWNQEKALAAISQAGGLIVGVDYSSSQSGIQDHFVFFHGNGELEDSLNGVVRPSNFYKVISMRIFELKIVQQEATMSEDQKKALKILESFRKEFKHGNLEGAINAAIGAVRDIPKKEDEKRNDLKEKCIFLSNLISDTSNTLENIGKIDDIQKLGTVWQSLVESAMKFIEKITVDKNTNFNQYRDKNNEFNAMKYMAGDLSYLLMFAYIKFGKKNLDEYLKTELPLVMKSIQK